MIKLVVSIGGDRFEFDSDEASVGDVVPLLAAFTSGRGPDPAQSQVDDLADTLDETGTSLGDAVNRAGDVGQPPQP